MSWLKSQRGFKRIVKEMGLNKEQSVRLKASMSQGDDAVLHTIEEIQNEQKEALKAKGIDYSNKVPIVGKEIGWNDILSMAFRVADFDRNSTVITASGEVKAASRLKPYGYLLVNAPTLNQPVGLPIIHRDDFVLASSVFDDPDVVQVNKAQAREFLVTYQPEKTLKDGRSAFPSHCLHYAIAPAGALDRYYHSDKRMSNPEPELLFGPFVYRGEISVFMNLGRDI